MKPAAPPLSKRQRRAQGSNPSTTWQQQPRIKSAESRARAYINYAGLADDRPQTTTDGGDGGDGKGSKSKKKAQATKPKDDGIDPKLSLDSPEVKFGISDANSSALIETPGQEDAVYVVMPMRL